MMVTRISVAKRITKLITKRMKQLDLFKKDLPSAVDDAAEVMSQQLELLNRDYPKTLESLEDKPLTWKEVLKDPESAVTLGCVVVVVLLMIFW